MSTPKSFALIAAPSTGIIIPFCNKDFINVLALPVPLMLNTFLMSSTLKWFISSKDSIFKTMS